MTHRRFAFITGLLLLSAPLMAAAQPMGEPPMGGGPPGFGGPSFMENIFPPGLIMRHQSDIGLTDAQRDAISKQMQEAQNALLPLQWDVERESEKLGKLLAADRVDESAALHQGDQVMNAEERLKKAHLTLLIRIKNDLTPAQQQKLRALRPEHHGGPPHGD